MEAAGDPYDELGVDAGASTVEIRRAYLALARRHHPDRLGDAPPPERERAASRMARINAAWSVLSDPVRRAALDAGRAGTDHATTSDNVRDPGDTFRPFTEVPDEIDPRLLDDRPIGSGTLHRSLAFVPAGFAVAGVVLCVLGAMLGFIAVLTFGLVSLGLSAVSFLLVPLVALANSSRADRDP